MNSVFESFFNMKTIMIFVLVLGFVKGSAQDSVQIKKIDALVAGINSSSLPVQRDTLNQNYPDLGLKMVTYLSMIMNGGELMKYVNLGYNTRTENGVTLEMITSNTFYYEHNKLIKVEEYVIEGDKKQTADWYYWDSKPLYYTFKSDKSAERANSLLTIANAMVKQVIK